MAAYAELPSDEPPPSRGAKLELALKGAGNVANKIGAGLRGASSVLADPRANDIDSLLTQGDLPVVRGEEPLVELLARLDAEADLWRALAFRELAQLRWTTRVFLIVSSLVMLAEVTLGGTAALGAVFGGSGTGMRRSLLIGAGSLSLVVALAAFAAVLQLARRASRDIMREALARADLAELRLHRVSLALAGTKVDPSKAAEVLARLEAETRR